MSHPYVDMKRNVLIGGIIVLSTPLSLYSTFDFYKHFKFKGIVNNKKYLCTYVTSSDYFPSV